MEDPGCPECDAPLTARGSFCRECGWDAELQAAEDRGEGVDVPDEWSDEDYEQALAREGLGGGALRWGALALTVLLIAGLLLAALLAALR